MKLFVRAICLVLLVSMSLCALSSCFLFKKECKHTYSSDWSYDETNHWRAATCEHTDLKKNEEAHTFGSDNKCITCGYEKKSGSGGGSSTPAGPTTETFTVTVVDASGAAVSGVEIKFVMPQFSMLPEITDASGKVTADLAKDVECCAMVVSVPNGYVLDATTRYEFTNNAVTITLQAE
ncbi:MAG: hypothetical protein E7676_06545 [Ruminococcaceae bacterium]|nr:hypothetical protein [Oscillospiraceae bacterium]